MGREQCTLLMAGADIKLREVCRDALSQNPLVRYTFQEAGTGELAWQEIQESLPDCLMLADVLLDQSGLEFLDRWYLKGDQPPCPVVFLVSRGRELLAAKALKRGAQDYLSTEKLTQDTLVKAIEYAIGKYRPFEGLSAISHDSADSRRDETEQKILVSIVESCQEAIIGRDLEGIITSWNPAAERLYGYSSQEAIGHQISLLIPHHNEEYLQNMFTSVKQGVAVLPFELQKRRKDGTILDVSISISPIFDEEGKVIGTSTISLDITQRKQAENVLKESEERFRNQYQSVPIPTYTWRKSGKDFVLVDWNLAAREATEGKIDSLRGVTAAELHANSPEILADFARCFAGRGIVRRETPYVYWSTGKCSDLEISYTFVPPDLVMIHTQDVTERNKSQEETRRRNHELTLLNSMMSSVNSSLKLSSVLELLKKMLQAELHIEAGAVFLDPKAKERVSLQLSWGFAENGLNSVTRPLAAAFEKPCPPAEVEPDFMDLTEALTSALERAETSWESFLAFPLLAEGKFYGVAALFSHDPDAFREEQLPFYEALGSQISVAIHNAQLFDQVRAGRKQLQTLSQQLIQTQETERRHIARELHDQIGQALTTIKINIEMAKRKSQDVLALTPLLEDSLSLVSQTLQQARTLSLDLHPSLLDDFGLTAALRWYVDQQGKRSGLQVKFQTEEYDARLPEIVEITCYRIAQEAITNILRHSGASRIELELHFHGGQELELIVRDDGVGFDSDCDTDDIIHKKSLGLLGMEERAILAGGHLYLRSAPGRGTEVRVLFPLASLKPHVERRRKQRRCK